MYCVFVRAPAYSAKLISACQKFLGFNVILYNSTKVGSIHAKDKKWHFDTVEDIKFC